MKTTFKILLLLALLLSFTRCEKEPEPEPESTLEIPDVNFLNALIAEGVDLDGNGKISSGEASRVHYLDVSSCEISDLSGIE
jgi:hypothetical protein